MIWLKYLIYDYYNKNIPIKYDKQILIYFI